MSDDARRSRSHIEMVAFAESPEIPPTMAAPLLKRSVPKEMLGLYRAANDLALLESSGGRKFVRFGFVAYKGLVCLDPQTGAVVILMDTQGGGDYEEVGVVNSSLELFITSVISVLKRYPFDSPPATNESEEDYFDRTSAELHQAADDLKKSLRDIDPTALDAPSRFWLTFIDDVEMGSYSSTD